MTYPPSYIGYISRSSQGNPTAPLCTWVVGPWIKDGRCRGRKQRWVRTVTSDVPGCTPLDPKPDTSKVERC